MKAFKPNECDFLILNLLNEYDSSSLMNSLLQDAKERHETFGDGFAECVQFAQTFQTQFSHKQQDVWKMKSS